MIVCVHGTGEDCLPDADTIYQQLRLASETTQDRQVFLPQTASEARRKTVGLLYSLVPKQTTLLRISERGCSYIYRILVTLAAGVPLISKAASELSSSWSLEYYSLFQPHQWLLHFTPPHIPSIYEVTPLSTIVTPIPPPPRRGFPISRASTYTASRHGRKAPFDMDLAPRPNRQSQPHP